MESEDSDDAPSAKRAKTVPEADSSDEEQYTTFDPLYKTNKSVWKLPRKLAEYTNTHFSEWLGEEAVQDNILKRSPVPELSCLKALPLDPDIVELLPQAMQTPAKLQDSTFMRVQKKMIEVMGPLGKLWTRLEAARKQLNRCLTY
jgi:hypothetical protein